MKPLLSRREFSRLTVGAAVATTATVRSPYLSASEAKPAVLGGKPVFDGEWPKWPVSDEHESQALQDVLLSGRWFRNAPGGKSTVDLFEEAWAKHVSVLHCQATNSGTSALFASLAALGISPGDEVIIPPYTFIASVNCVLLRHALPVFVDTDPATAQWDVSQIEARLTNDTRALLPVHLGGASCDMDAVMAIASRRNLRVVEDACQAHTGEWNGRRLGTFGDTGCFSFQNSKNITCGDGGALVTSQQDIYYRTQAFQNQGIGKPIQETAVPSGGGNFRLTQFQGAILLQQLKRLDEQSHRREQNAIYLRELLGNIEGVTPKKILSGTTRHGCHLFVFDFDRTAFAGMTKDQFVRAVSAEGIPISKGYSALNKDLWVERMLADPSYQRIYGAARLKRWRDENLLPANDRMLLTTCWFSQFVLLSDRAAMERIADALSRVQRFAAAIAKK